MKFFRARFSVFIFVFSFAITAAAVTDRVVISGMDRPWAVVSGPDGNIWITEKRTGHIRIYTPQFVQLKTVTGLPNFAPYVEGGLLDIAFHPRFNETKWLYVAYTAKNSKDEYYVQLTRFTYDNGKLKDFKVLLNGPASPAGNHFGSRLLFDDRGFLYATFGERLDKDKAQDMNQLNGKIVRLTDDGKIPSDNPFGPQSPIYSLGHRNPQGLALHPVSRTMYDSEHGPSGFDAPGGGDEINTIVAGGNYGWPIYHHTNTAPGYWGPLLEYTPAIAPSGIAFYTGTALPKWKNDLFVACLKGQKVLRVRIDTQGHVTETEFLLENKYGRLRDIETSPDGTLLVLAEEGNLIQLK